MPESTALVRALASTVGQGTGSWCSAMRWRGTSKAVFDEYAHVLEESLGLMDHPALDVVRGIAGEMLEALSIPHLPGSNGQHPLHRTRCADRSQSLQHPQPVRAPFRRSSGRTGESVQRADIVRKAFNSPFRPFILASTPSARKDWISTHIAMPSITGICRTIPLIWSRGKAACIATRDTLFARTWLRFTVLTEIQTDSMDGLDPWKVLFQRARDDRPQDSNDLIPYWIFEQGRARVERRVPLLPFSREVDPAPAPAREPSRSTGSPSVSPARRIWLEYLRRRRDEDAGDRDLEQFRDFVGAPEWSCWAKGLRVVMSETRLGPMDKSPLLERPGRRSQDGRWSGSCRGDRSRVNKRTS